MDFDRVLDISSEQELVALALRIEEEAAAQYERLASDMRACHNEATARLFDRLAAEERDHGAAIESHYHQDEPVGANGAWDMPVEMVLGRKVGDPFLMTPYDAISYALHNEKRGLDLFIHLAAHAEDVAVRVLAETFAKEEISHIAQLRLARLEASRDIRNLRESLGWWQEPALLSGLAELDRQCARMEAHAAIVYDQSADGQMGDAYRDSRDLLVALAREAAQRAHALDPTVEKPETIHPMGKAAPLDHMIRALRYSDQILEYVTLAAEQARDDDLYRALSGQMEYYADRLNRIRAMLKRHALDYATA